MDRPNADAGRMVQGMKSGHARAVAGSSEKAAEEAVFIGYRNGLDAVRTIVQKEVFEACIEVSA